MISLNPYLRRLSANGAGNVVTVVRKVLADLRLRSGVFTVAGGRATLSFGVRRRRRARGAILFSRRATGNTCAAGEEKSSNGAAREGIMSGGVRGFMRDFSRASFAHGGSRAMAAEGRLFNTMRARWSSLRGKHPRARGKRDAVFSSLHRVPSPRAPQSRYSLSIRQAGGSRVRLEDSTKGSARDPNASNNPLLDERASCLVRRPRRATKTANHKPELRQMTRQS